MSNLLEPDTLVQLGERIPLRIAVAHSGFPPEDWNRVHKFSENKTTEGKDLINSKITLSKAGMDKAITAIIKRRKSRYFLYD